MFLFIDKYFNIGMTEKNEESILSPAMLTRTRLTNQYQPPFNS